VRKILSALIVCFLSAPPAALAEGTRADPSPTTAHNALTAEEQQAGWRLLFDGNSLDGWRSYHASGLPAGWQVDDGTLHRAGRGGDIVTVDSFADFELSLEWKVAVGGNSGIFYRAAPGEKQIYFSAPEMQVLDDARHRDGGDPLTSAGAAYGLYPAPRGVVHAAGEWNSARIRVEGGHVEHWLNGQKLLEYTLGSDDWKARVAKSKFAGWPAYGRASTGHIGLQDHGDPVWYRDIKIRVLD
jgi:hypothetical protein